MASTHSNAFYDDETLCALELALRDIWQVLKAHEPYPNWDSDPELKQELAFMLLALAHSGIRDPQELRRRTLEGFPLSPCH